MGHRDGTNYPQGGGPRPSGGQNRFGGFGGDSTAERSGRFVGNDPIFGAAERYQDEQQSKMDELLAQIAAFASGGGGGGGGTRKQKIIDLDPFKNKELDAMRELLKQRTQGTRTELTGDRARIGNAFTRFEALRLRKRDDDFGTNRSSASRRGILDSGVFEKDAAEIRNISDSDISTEDTRSTTLVNALSAQIGGQYDYLGRDKKKQDELDPEDRREGPAGQDYGVGTLEALRSAQEASSTADIERSYLNARISQGGQG